FSDLALGFDASLSDGSPSDPREALKSLEHHPDLPSACYLLPESKGIPLVEVVDGVPVHTPRALREALVAVKDHALADHGIDAAAALAVIEGLALKCGVTLSAPSLSGGTSDPVAPEPDLVS